MSERKSILITGATGGIGSATAKYLVEQGYFIVMVGRDQEKLDALSGELAPYALSFPYDLRDLYNIESIFNFLSENNIKLDGMVHAAGTNHDIAIRANDVDMMQEVTAVNYMSFVELLKYFFKKKYSNEGASVVAVSSRATLFPAQAMCTYVSSKSALEGAVKVAALEAAKRHIRVNAILPGGTDTDMLVRAGITHEDIEQRQPLGMILPVEIAYLIEFLLGSKSSRITGAFIPITAGHLW
jgi:NAD(P)-dependent dehydrogenase (short-subunit alcohol dehydrogenase family)